MSNNAVKIKKEIKEAKPQQVAMGWWNRSKKNTEKTKVDTSKRQGRGTHMNIINYVNSDGSMSTLPTGWTMQDAREYIKQHAR